MSKQATWSKTISKMVGTRPWPFAVACGLLLGLALLLGGAAALRNSVLRQAEQRQVVLASGVGGIQQDASRFMDVLRKQATNKCDPDNLKRIRLLMLHTQYIRGVGLYNAEGKLYCTTAIGQLPSPVTDPDDWLPTQAGGQLFLDVPLLDTGGKVHALVYRDRLFDIIFDPYAIQRLLHGWNGVVWLHFKGRFTPIVVHGTTPVALARMQAEVQGTQQSRVIRYRSVGAQVITMVRGTGVALSSAWSPAAIARAAPMLALITLLAAIGMSGLSVIAFGAMFARINALDRRIRGLCREENVLCLYQPIVDLDSLKLIGCEVLMRLMDGERVLSPATVFPRVHRKRLTWQLDHAVMSCAMRELGAHAAELTGMKVGFNLHPDDVDYDKAGHHLTALRDKHGLHSIQLDIEVTEHDFSPDVAIEAARFREAGFLVSVDDFGTGHSNLAVVHGIQPDFLKIDKSFTAELGMPGQSTSLVPQIVAIAKAVHAKVIAEGIEREAQIGILKSHGVTYGQGYYFSQPLPMETFLAFLRETNGEPANHG